MSGHRLHEVNCLLKSSAFLPFRHYHVRSMPLEGSPCRNLFWERLLPHFLPQVTALCGFLSSHKDWRSYQFRQGWVYLSVGRAQESVKCGNNLKSFPLRPWEIHAGRGAHVRCVWKWMDGCLPTLVVTSAISSGCTARVHSQAPLQSGWTIEHGWTIVPDLVSKASLSHCTSSSQIKRKTPSWR